MVDPLTIASIGLGLFSMFGRNKAADEQSRQAHEQSRQAKRQAAYDAAAIRAQMLVDVRNRADEVSARTSRAKVSFLNSGLTLEGTPLSALEGMFEAGLEDITIMRQNAGVRIGNVHARAEDTARRARFTARRARFNAVIGSMNDLTSLGMGLISR